MPTTELPTALTAQLQAINAHDADAIMATFAPDALVNDNHREFFGADAIRDFIEREIVGDNVTFELVETLADHGDLIIRLRSDGDYDKTNVPDPLILTGYVKTGPAGIERLIIIHNQDPEA